MIDVASLKDDQLARLINSRWESSSTLWSEIEGLYEKALKIWQNVPHWVDSVPKNKSDTRDNRIFQSVEYVISNLTGRPSMPNVIPANDTQEAVVIADNLQDFFLGKYKDLRVKEKFRKGLRYLSFCRLIVLKPFWNYDIDDFDVRAVDPRKVRFYNRAARSPESPWAIEEIQKPLLEVLDIFADEQKEITDSLGYDDEAEMYIKNPEVTYYEAWIGDWVIYKLKDKNKIIKKEPHPYWDWEGLLMTEEESGRLNKLSGRRRRTQAAQVKKWRELRKELKEGGREYELYLYNHMDQPTPPYIFGTIFNVEDKPIGETSLLEQANPLQEAIDRRKRQFDDNADLMNGVMKVDTKHAKITEAQAKRFKANPKGIWYGEGVGPGVTRETGKELPSFLFNDLEHSIRELDNLFGTQPTFRGEKGATETATGRAILREQSYQRLNELIDLMDSLHEQLYNWWFQLMKVRYTDTHLVKPMGAPKAVETISLTQDDLQEGIEIKIIPGQIMPEDRLYRAERATEAAKDGLIDPLTYFEATDWDNPMEQAKRIEMYKLNPFSVIELTDEDLEKLQRAMQMMGGPPGAGGGEGGDPRAQAVAQLRQRAQELINSPDFQKLPPDEQKAALSQLRNQLAGVTGAQ